ncbi:predicted protein [Sclerotinia sclerotiorum 1980 UF-70]|uniref:Uncharacterized protein n=1 Tax=Sclerotinia sclerotiorum (strain ATCC 18683 / 1980 / Ss-1) TaxID=665079 RepID=A7EU60_SCLS1|nr:predicted protein [Sclerotinia sclerotiorum 1980 UF-70]EDN93002.1 predicted protein [Sclerotinia sclerotiorum 1980 UF-70]
MLLGERLVSQNKPIDVFKVETRARIAYIKSTAANIIEAPDSAPPTWWSYGTDSS